MSLLTDPPTNVVSAPAGRVAIAPRYATAAEWSRALGDIPLERIRFDPWPGTATEADLLRINEGDGPICELIDGTLVEKAVGWDDELVGSELLAALVAFVKPRKLGWVNGAAATIRMAGGRLRVPDVSFVARSAFPEGKRPRAPIPLLPPTLAIEVLSPSNTRAEIAQKLREYFESGCRLAWIIDPRAQTCEVYRDADAPTRRMTADERLDGEDVLPGFSLRLGDLFADL